MRRSFMAAFLAVGLAGARLTAADPAPPAAAAIPRKIPSPAGRETPPASTVDWASFLGRQDMVWPSVPQSPDAAPFIGNGSIGALIHREGNDALSWEINRTDVTHRGMRIPMGRVVLRIGGGPVDGTARLDLWNAEVQGTFAADEGEVRWRSFAAASPSVIVIELSGLRMGREADLLWWPALVRPPPRGSRADAFDPDDLNAPPQMTTGVGTVASTQSFADGGAFAVVLRRILSAGERKIYVVGVGRGAQDSAALAEATSAVERAASIGIDRLVAAHRLWWHQYYPASFASFPDSRLQAFYWIQMYKLASAMRADGPIPGVDGPWYRNAPVKPIGWDLNVAAVYAPIFTGNRMALGESLFTALDRYRQNLINNAPPELHGAAAAIGAASDQNLVSPVNLGAAQSDMQRETGNLAWAAFLDWKYSRYRMDDAILRDRVLPLLARSTAYYLSIVKLGADGRYHLPPTLSPVLGSVADANYDLALLRWSLQTLIDSAQRLRLNDSQLPHWREVLERLPAYPANGQGLLVGRDRPLDESQPRYSHLLAISPLHLLRPDRRPERKLIEDSLRSWVSRPAAFRGYSYGNAAAIDAYLGDGDRALASLHEELDHFLRPNTFDPDPLTTLGAPLAAASSVQDLLLQSWGGRLHVFPAMPSAWKEASFANLRGEGAFLVSAVWQDGKAAWVRVESQVGGPCRLDVAGWSAAVARSASRPGLAPAAGRAPGDIVVALPRGAWVVLAAAAGGSLPPIAPVAGANPGANPYPPAAPPSAL